MEIIEGIVPLDIPYQRYVSSEGQFWDDEILNSGSGDLDSLFINACHTSQYCEPSLRMFFEFVSEGF